MHVVEDVLRAVTRVACAFRTVAKIQLRIGLVRLATNEAAVAAPLPACDWPQCASLQPDIRRLWIRARCQASGPKNNTKLPTVAKICGPLRPISLEKEIA